MNFPRPQTSTLVEPLPWATPPTASLHELDDNWSSKYPDGHNSHCVSPGILWKLPGEHCVHRADRGKLAYVPASHLSHPTDASDAAEYPAGHPIHVTLPTKLYVPGGH